MLKNLSKKIGFTGNEISVIIFLLITLSLGAGYKYFFKENTVEKYQHFDYAKEDSLFNLTSESSLASANAIELEDKKVDYKQEVLDFNARNFNKSEPKKTPAEKSINLNNAGINELIMLPGIGEKTAEKILALRKERGRFKKIEDLMEVKGIGTSKLAKIKKYIFID